MTAPIMEINSSRHPLMDGNPPTWASGWGQDEFGVWVEFTLEGDAGPVTQRMRWIPPGRFMMGSPEDEEGRYEQEGPVHPVILTNGYWLFDTQVTQELWQLVMGNNPSRFQSTKRPVENVSWDDCHRFLEKINGRIADLNLTLPSEAQWEYGCRAGEQGAIYTGPLEIIGDGNAPALDPIAWYGGNSGKDFNLNEGRTVTWLKNRQYDENPSGTHQVALKIPNKWGLHDMLGNVWEWCLDGESDYTGEEVINPKGTTKPGARRVVRGGSWYVKARYCRCAYRRWFHPDVRRVERLCTMYRCSLKMNTDEQ